MIIQNCSGDTIAQSLVVLVTEKPLGVKLYLVRHRNSVDPEKALAQAAGDLLQVMTPGQLWRSMDKLSGMYLRKFGITAIRPLYNERPAMEYDDHTGKPIRPTGYTQGNIGKEIHFDHRIVRMV